MAQDSVQVIVEDGSNERDYRLKKQYESFLSLELINFYERQMSVFSAQKLYLNMEKLNIFLNQSVPLNDFFDCSLVTKDNKYTVKHV